MAIGAGGYHLDLLRLAILRLILHPERDPAAGRGIGLGVVINASWWCAGDEYIAGDDFDEQLVVCGKEPNSCDTASRADSWVGFKGGCCYEGEPPSIVAACQATIHQHEECRAKPGWRCIEIPDSSPRRGGQRPTSAAVARAIEVRAGRLTGVSGADSGKRQHHTILCIRGVDAELTGRRDGPCRIGLPGVTAIAGNADSDCAGALDSPRWLGRSVATAIDGSGCAWGNCDSLCPCWAAVGVAAARWRQLCHRQGWHRCRRHG